MTLDWLAIAFGDVVWLATAFALGFASRLVGLPPLVGFLAAGFLLHAQGFVGGELLQKLSDLGITLLLFTVGLKLNLKTLARPQVWAVTGLHAALVVAVFGSVLYALALVGVPLLDELSFFTALLIAFALSFSSTVFVVKVLEQKGEMQTLHGRVAIGILIMQDLVAVIFLTVSSGKWPSFWALALLLLIPLRGLLHQLLQRVGHGELLVLYGFLLALGGAELFELVGLKGDLGALFIGILIASASKAEELAKNMLGFKNLFLLGFFLLVGMSGEPSVDAVVLGVVIAPFALLKSGLFFALLNRFNLRARTSLLSSLSLMNFSEFGLIVASIGVSKGWISADWLIVIAVALSVSFVFAAGFNRSAHTLFSRHREFWRRFQRVSRLADDRFHDIEGATIAVIGMGGIGTGAYDKMREHHGETVIGIDIDPLTVGNHQASGRRVLPGDPGDADFWDRVAATHSLTLVMLALPKLSTSLAVLHEIKTASFEGDIAVTAKFSDEEDELLQAGATTVFNIYTEAGAGFASHVDGETPLP